VFELESRLLLSVQGAVGRRAEVVARGYEACFGDVRYSCRKRGCKSRTKETSGTRS
jgi:hypothetical protein